jgi:hypothetical protein
LRGQKRNLQPHAGGFTPTRIRSRLYAWEIKTRESAKRKSRPSPSQRLHPDANARTSILLLPALPEIPREKARSCLISTKHLATSSVRPAIEAGLMLSPEPFRHMRRLPGCAFSFVCRVDNAVADATTHFPVPISQKIFFGRKYPLNPKENGRAATVLTGLELKINGFVSGHGFSRAVKVAQDQGLQPLKIFPNSRI